MPGVAALLAAVDGLRRGRTGWVWAAQAWALAALAHLVLFLPLLEWTRFLGVVPWLLLCTVQALIAGLVGPLLALPRGSGRAGGLVLVLGVAGAWVAVEAVRGRVPFGGLTWGRLAFGQADGPLLGAAGLAGAPLVTALVAALGALLFWAVRATWQRRSRPIAAAGAGAAAGAAAAALLTGPVLLRPALAPPSTGSVEVAAVQGNVPRGDALSGLDVLGEDMVVLDNHVQQTEQLAADVRTGVRPRPDLVIWPENASDQDPRQRPDVAARLTAASAALGGRPFLLGVVLEQGDRAGNALLVWSGDRIAGQPYLKRHLVPFGEYLPLRRLVERLYPAARDLLPRDFEPGDRVGRLELAGVPLAVGTCFEVAFDGPPRDAVRAGGQLLVLPSNNASYGRSGQSGQQLAMARLRAVEHGRATVVATTSGISALIGPDGTVRQRSGLYTPAVLQARLPRATALTPATRWGGYAELALAALAAFLAARPHHPARRQPDTSPNQPDASRTAEQNRTAG